VIDRLAQIHENLLASLMADSDLLPVSFWGLGKLAVTDKMIYVTNTLREGGHTPAFCFEGRSYFEFTVPGGLWKKSFLYLSMQVARTKNTRHKQQLIRRMRWSRKLEE